MRQLHILNGDAILDLFDQANIAGEVLVWREILCEGKTVEDVTSDEFWETRLQFLESYVDQFEPAQHTQFKDRLQNIDLGTFDEVVLWFEYDLFCQINMLAVVSWLRNNLSGLTAKVALVCVGEHPNYAKMVGLGELNVEEFKALYPQRIVLSDDDLAFADQVWKMYCSGQHTSILPLVQRHTAENFPYLEAAMEAHQKRFPNTVNGLNSIEAKMLSQIEKGAKTARQLVGDMLRMQTTLGFGDLQYFKCLESMAPILEIREGRYYLNENGVKVKAHLLDFNTLRESVGYYGGISHTALRWDAHKGELVDS